MERRGKRQRWCHWLLGVLSVSALDCRGEPPDGESARLAAALTSSAPFVESGGMVVMEAENATGTAPGSGIAAGSTWTSRVVSTASLGTAIEATPNAGVRTGDSTVGPRRDYTVRFATPGTYQLWVRGRGPTADDDTIHVGLNGTPVTLGASGLLFPGAWTWLNTVGSRRVTITVTTPGLATINLWMREDGVLVDKVLLTSSSSFIPSGTGPAESAREEPAPADGGSPPPPASGAFREGDGQVVMEAENATGAAAGTGIAAGSTWTPRAVVGASGGTVLEATPNAGVRTLDSTVGPRLDYAVRFATSGTYQLWVRARGPTSDDDTIHAGLNGTPVTLGGSGLLFPSGWTWVNTVGSRRVTITVTSPGLATINLWMREDGVLVDKVLLTTSSSFVPADAGPPESVRDNQPPPDAGAPMPDAGTPPPDGGAPAADAAPPPPPGSFLESDGQVVMEAENATGAAAGSGIAASSTWTQRSATDASGGALLEATPNAGVRTLDSTVGPRLDYAVRFATTGTYQLWVRARGPTSDDDTIHAGLNGTPATLGASGLLFPGGWTWINTVGSRRVTITVTSPGLATINLWMREDGVLVDKVLLTTSPSFVPAGTGPAESPREGSAAAAVLPPGLSWCDATCLARPPAQITSCPGSTPGCTANRATTVAWTLQGRPFSGVLLAINGNNVVSRVDSGNAGSITSQLIRVDEGRAAIKSDADVTLTNYDVAPLWGGETRLDFQLVTLSGSPMSTLFYSYAGYPVGDTPAQVHQAVVSIIADEVRVAELSPLHGGLAYFTPSELSIVGEGNFAFPDGSVQINYTNPAFWAGSGQTILSISAQEFSHEYGHQIFAAIQPPYGTAPDCLDEGAANAIGFVVGRVPASKLGPVGGMGENFDGDCKLAHEHHDVGNCYFFHVNKAGLLNDAFMRAIYHPQHVYRFDSCNPASLRTGDSLVVIFTEATGQDQTALVQQMGMPTSGSYDDSKVTLGL
jgi:hypothetical protein